MASIMVLAGFLSFPAMAQSPDDKNLIINQSDKVNVLLKKHIALNSKLNGVMDGFRIMVFFDSGSDSKKRAVDARADFMNRFPGVPAYITFQEPYFKVRVGDFRSKIEADGFLAKIQGDYPNAFRVKDRINFPKID